MTSSSRFPPHNIGVVRRHHQHSLHLISSWMQRLASLVFLAVIFTLSFPSSRQQHVVNGMVIVPSKNVSYPSMPAWYYGKGWDTTTSSSPSSSSSTNSTILAGANSGDDDDDKYMDDKTMGTEEDVLLPTVVVHLQYYDIDYCKEFATVAAQGDDDDSSIYHRNPIPKQQQLVPQSANETTQAKTREDEGIIPPSNTASTNLFASSPTADQGLQQQQQQQDEEALPIALLVYDYDHGEREVKHRPCHLIDYERLAIAWNVSYIIFYHDEQQDSETETENKNDENVDDTSATAATTLSLNSYYEQNQAYLDSPILSETNSIGFQLVSYHTALALRSLMDSNNGGIVIHLDGRVVSENADTNLHNDRNADHASSPKALIVPPPRFTTSQIRIRKLIALIPMVTGLLSFLGSSYIVYSLVATKVGRAKKLQTTFNRLLLALSISDMISSFATCLSQWVFPKEAFPGIDPEWHGFTFPYASGTNGSCSFQGFLIQLGFHGSVIFTACISIQYVLVVRYRWTQRRLRKLEMAFFGVGIAAPVTTAISLLAMDAYHPKVTGICWIGVDPYYCKDSSVGWCAENKTFGDHLRLVLIISTYIWLLSTLVIIVVSMVLLFLTVRAQEAKSSRWSPNGQERTSQVAVVKLASSYLGAYLFTWSWFVLIFTSKTKSRSVQSFIQVLVATVVPMQGVFNVLIYSKKYRLLCYIFRCRYASSQGEATGTYNDERATDGGRFATGSENSTNRINQLQQRQLPWLPKLVMNHTTTPAPAPQSSCPPSQMEPVTEQGSSTALRSDDQDVSVLLEKSGFF